MCEANATRFDSSRHDDAGHERHRNGRHFEAHHAANADNFVHFA
jgi:hypothetical protein